MLLRTWLALAAHYGEYILHPVELHLRLSLTAYSIVEVSNSQKQSVSNAFQYVVPHPAAPSSSEDITATMGRKHLQKYKTFEKTQRKTFKSLEFTKIVRFLPNKEKRTGSTRSLPVPFVVSPRSSDFRHQTSSIGLVLTRSVTLTAVVTAVVVTGVRAAIVTAGVAS